MDQHKVFAPIADPGQLAHQSATHSNALVDNPFAEGAEGAESAETADAAVAAVAAE
ncbi:streptamidine family RiPP [Streptomyces sp. NPDC058953]|uniref:streptamidine family RiPP n=1 Tax=unclassified Streptomyces TaxID=2593676 RepID=UPI00368FFF48